MVIPRVGDYWEFRLPSGNKTRKVITEIRWKEEGIQNAWQSTPWKERKRRGNKYSAILFWSHTPKARYISPVSVRGLFTRWKGRLISRRKSKRRQ